MTLPLHLSLYDFLTESEEEDAEYLISGVLPKTGLCLILGAYSTGKTLLAFRIAASVATGSMFGDGKAPIEDVAFDFCFPALRGYTLYFAGEDKQNVKKRIKGTKLSLDVHELEELNQNYNGILPIIPVKINAPLKEEGHIEEIENIIAQARQAMPALSERPALMIFDTLIACFSLKDENNNSEMQKIARTFEAYAEHFNCCVLVIAHPPKSNDGPKGYSRGASALSNSAHVILEIKGVNASGHREISIKKMKNGPYAGTRFRFKAENFGPAPALVPVKISAQADNKKTATAKVMNDLQKQVIALLNAAPEKEAKQAEIIKSLLSTCADTTDIKSEQRMMRRHIKGMQEMGLVQLQSVGKNVVVRLVSNGHLIGTDTDTQKPTE